LDRTIEVSVTNTVEKRHIMRRLGPNLKTLRQLLKQNQQDYLTAISRRTAWAIRRAAWQRLVRRRYRAVRLVEELNLRANRLQPLFNKLCEISRRMATLKLLIREVQTSGYIHGCNLVELEAELRHLMRITQESPATLKRRVDRTSTTAASTTQPSGPCRPATCGWSCRSPKNIVTAD
jgi:RNA polymerase primary sigma factor